MLGRVVVVLCFLAGTAHAIRAPLPLCWTEYQILPAEGALDVPLNAKVWIIGSIPHDRRGFDDSQLHYRLRGPDVKRVLKPKVDGQFTIELPLGELRAETTYEVLDYETVLTRFTTGTAWQTERPNAPDITSITISDAKRIESQLDTPERAVLTHITVTPLNDARPVGSLLAPKTGFTGQPAACASGWFLAHADACFEIRALDIAGNYSAPASYCVRPDNGALAAAGVTSTSSDDTHGVAIAFLLMGLCGLAFTWTRANAVRRTFATSRLFSDVDLELVQRVARAQRARTIWFAAACAVAFGAVASLPIGTETRIVLVVTPTMLFTIAVIALCRLQLLVGLRPEPSLRVTSHGLYLFASRDHRLVGWVGATPALIARASALPVAKARRV